MKRRIIASICAALMGFGTVLTSCSKEEEIKLIRPKFYSENLAAGAAVTYESLRKFEKKDEEKDAENLFLDNDKAWTPQDLNRSPIEGQEDVCNTMVEFKLKSRSTFNTALIEEIGNEVQYFRLQAYVNDTWQTIYQSEKIQEMRLCSFDAVTTDKLRLSIDKFRSKDTPAQIKSLQLYTK